MATISGPISGYSGAQVLPCERAGVRGGAAAPAAHRERGRVRFAEHGQGRQARGAGAELLRLFHERRRVGALQRLQPPLRPHAQAPQAGHAAAAAAAPGASRADALPHAVRLQASSTSCPQPCPSGALPAALPLRRLASPTPCLSDALRLPWVTCQAAGPAHFGDAHLALHPRRKCLPGAQRARAASPLPAPPSSGPLPKRSHPAAYSYPLERASEAG